MKTLDDIRAALDGCEYEIQEGTDPVVVMRVSAEPALDALSWIRKRPDFVDGLRGVVVVPLGTSATVRATLIRATDPRLVFARVASRLFPPDYVNPSKEGIGSTGFGFVRNEQGELERFPHYGRIGFGEDVQIGHFTCIDRGALTDTIIEDGVKLDNLVHIAHGAHIGAHTSIAALTCIEGSVKIGKRCTIGSGVTFQIGSGCGDDVTVGSGSVVTKWIPSGETWVGSPARPLVKKSDLDKRIMHIRAIDPSGFPLVCGDKVMEVVYTDGVRCDLDTSVPIDDWWDYVEMKRSEAMQ